MYLCPECFLAAYCRRLASRLVSDAELANPDFVRDVRAYAAGLKGGADRWAGSLIDAYCDYPGTIVDADGREAVLDLSVFDKPGIRYWFRDFCKAVPPGTTPCVRSTRSARSCGASAPPMTANSSARPSRASMRPVARILAPAGAGRSSSLAAVGRYACSYGKSKKLDIRSKVEHDRNEFLELRLHDGARRSMIGALRRFYPPERRGCAV